MKASPCQVLAILLVSPLAHAADKNLMSKPEVGAVSGKLPSVPPTSPQEAAKTFRALDGFRMDLIASEPLVASPVAMAYDEYGRAYVCEMRDYPYTDKAHHKPNQENPTDQPIGRVRLLEDTDGDGVFDKSTVFAEGLSWPTGIACSQGGVFVAATPDLWFFKDTDGDGKTDVREKIFTGFKKLNVQAVMNNLVWGLDNHIHGAGGSNGGKISALQKTDTPAVVMARADFRIDPNTRAFELQSGGARFGGTFDDWGNRFLCNIRNPAQHILLPSHVLARNKSLAARSPIHDMAESGDQLPVHPISPPEPWRVIRAKRWAGERDILMPRSELTGAGVVTSASGITCYRGTAYPEKYQGNVFIAECAGNLFYRLQLTPEGPTFRATRADKNAEIVASTDNWFRPVNFCNAPDGTLTVIDMYRENIEHPWSIPEDIHAAVDLESGRDMGRLWRLSPPNFKPQKPPSLGSMSSAEWVTCLENPNAWWRETAQRLLFENRDEASVAPLQTMVRRGKSPQARLHALWTLESLAALTHEDLLAALKDSAPGVRKNAVQIAQTRPMLEALLPLSKDPEISVRFQAALSLGEFKDARAVQALAQIAKRDGADPWMRTAILTSAAESCAELLVELLQDKPFANASASANLLREIARILGARSNREEMQRIVSAAGADSTQSTSTREVIIGLGEGLKPSSQSLRSIGLKNNALTSINAFLSRAATIAKNETLPAEQRVEAIATLAFDDLTRVKELLSQIVGPTQPWEIQRAAIAALGSFHSPEVAPLLLENWKTRTPTSRSEVVAAMLGSRTRALPLLQAIDRGSIPASQIPFAQRRLLLLNADPEVKTLAEKFFNTSGPDPRSEVIERYKPALSKPGDPANGRRIFETTCIGCHRAADMGNRELGPNLASIRAWSPEQMLINILDPNREVAPNYLAYSIETKEGKALFGIITDENAASLTLKTPDGSTETVLRGNVTKIEGLGTSLMPDGLESAISPEQMADLISFLSSL